MWCNFKFEGVLFQSDSRHTSFRTQVRGLITELAQGLICPKSGTAFFHHDLSPTMISHRIINTIYQIGTTSRAGTAFLSGAPQLTHGSYWSSCSSIYIFCLDHPPFFSLVIILSVDLIPPFVFLNVCGYQDKRICILLTQLIQLNSCVCSQTRPCLLVSSVAAISVFASVGSQQIGACCRCLINRFVLLEISERTESCYCSSLYCQPSLCNIKYLQLLYFRKVCIQFYISFVLLLFLFLKL